MVDKDAELRVIFSDNLNYWTKVRDKRQDDIVRKFDLSSSTVSTWFTGSRMPRMNSIQKLADFLGIDKSDLIEERKSKVAEWTSDELRQIEDFKNFLRSKRKNNL